MIFCPTTLSVRGLYSEATTVFAPTALKRVLEMIRDTLVQDLVSKLKDDGCYDISDLYVPLPEAGVECDIIDNLRNAEMRRDIMSPRNGLAGTTGSRSPLATCLDQIQSLLLRGTHCATLDPLESRRNLFEKCDEYTREFAVRDSVVLEDITTQFIHSDLPASPPTAKLILVIAIICPYFKVTDKKAHAATRGSTVEAFEQSAAEYDFFAATRTPQLEFPLVDSHVLQVTFNLDVSVSCKDASDEDDQSVMLCNFTCLDDLPALRLDSYYTSMFNLRINRHAIVVRYLSQQKQTNKQTTNDGDKRQGLLIGIT